MSRISKVFTELERKGQGALIAYLMAGDPDPTATPVIATAIARHADIIELGIPFSDPIADGPTIQAAAGRALAAGMTPASIFALITAIRKETDVPIVVMGYYNPILRYGVQRFMQHLADAGGDGIIIPDLPLEEAKEVLRSARRCELDTIFLIAPTTPDERIAEICRYSSGFVYLVSLLGVTGARSALSDVARTLIQRVVKKRPDLPAAVGFGVSQPEHVRELLASGAKGVIVGSAIVAIIAKHKDKPEQMLAALDEYCAMLKAATKVEG
ncbi:MAG TPA: tryptophan synthase subunit alpha [Methanomicrobia archaeon]|nr:tryptophan synthase subunit alpha [Methanomicrobia archaeon]